MPREKNLADSCKATVTKLGTDLNHMLPYTHSCCAIEASSSVYLRAAVFNGFWRNLGHWYQLPERSSSTEPSIGECISTEMTPTVHRLSLWSTQGCVYVRTYSDVTLEEWLNLYCYHWMHSVHGWFRNSHLIRYYRRSFVFGALMIYLPVSHIMI